jgi:hypothetical protein
MNTDIREHMRAKHSRFGELDRLVERTGITRAQARELIKRYGNEPQTLLSHARNLYGTSRLS